MSNATEDNELFDFMEEPEVLLDNRLEVIRHLESNSFMIDKLEHLSRTLLVDGEGTCKKALNIAAEASKLHKQIEEYRKKAIEPSRKLIATINDAAKSLQEKLDSIKLQITAKVVFWTETQRQQAEAAQEANKKISETLGIDLAILSPEAPTKISSAHATIATRKTWNFEVMDETMVPMEYLVVDEAKIKKAIAAGVREIPGVRIWEGQITTIRRK